MSLFISRPGSIIGMSLTAFLSFAPLAAAWGEDGHSLINIGAAEMSESRLRPFLLANTASLGRLANVPDRLWKSGTMRAQEQFTHYFQWDHYSDSTLGPQMPLLVRQALTFIDRPFIVENGSAVWRINQIYDLLVHALRDHHWSQSLQLAGVLGHYVGDLSQPMHASSDYDGQSIGRRGIHAYYESTFVGQMNQGQLLSDVLATARGRRRVLRQELAVVDLALSEGKAALAQLPEILAAFDRRGYPDPQMLRPMIVRQLANGVVILKTLWDMAIAEADIAADIPSQPLTVADPAWIPLDF